MDNKYDEQIPEKWDDQLTSVKEKIEELEFCCYDKTESKLVDLKLKFMIAEALGSIRQQLFEISHYGIGTD